MRFSASAIQLNGSRRGASVPIAPENNSPQNSLGPGRSCLEAHVIRLAAAIMRAIPPMPITTCITTVVENWDRITKPTNESKTPTQ